MNIDQIINLIKKYQLILLSKKRLGILQQELEQEKENQRHLEEVCAKEHQDIIDLDSFSIYQVFNKILKNDVEQRDKEKQEYLVATLAYDESTKLIELLEYEIGILSKIVTDEDIILQTLNSSLKHASQESLYASSSFLAELKSVNQEITNLVRLKLEAEEVLDALQILRSSFKDLIKSLNQAKEANTWGKFYKEIQENKLKYRENIDKAHGLIPFIKKQLYFLKNELLDFEEYQQFFKSSELVIRGFNIEFYNDLITDWINDDNLIETLSSTMAANTTFLRLRKSLKHLIENTEVEMPHLISKRNKLIEKIELE